MTEKLDMEELFEDFESLPEKEDSVDLAEAIVPEDDFYEAPETADPVYPAYGEVAPVKYPTHDFKTKGGKNIVVYHEPMGTLWAIKFNEGGQLPSELKSKYTSEADAIEAVKLYVARNQ